jgi:hypothetical protein
VKKVTEKPWIFKDDGILSERRINQLSIAKLKEEYFKLGEVMKDSRHYTTYLSYRIRGYQARLKKRKRRRIAMLRRRVLKASYIRKQVREQHRVEIRKSRALIKKNAKIAIRKIVKIRLERAKKVIPRRLNKYRKHIRVMKAGQLKKSRRTIQKRLTRRKILLINKAKSLAKENAFIGLIKKEKLPGIGRYIGIYSLIIRKIAPKLGMKFEDMCCLLWFGNFETFNTGTLALMYPGLPVNYIRQKVIHFKRIEYIQHISTFRFRKTYSFTPLGKEFYNRIIRYMKRFKKPYAGKRITKKMVRTHFQIKRKSPWYAKS